MMNRRAPEQLELWRPTRAGIVSSVILSAGRSFAAAQDDKLDPNFSEPALAIEIDQVLGKRV